MAYINGADQLSFQGMIKGENGKSAFIRYSANADGTGFTETWSEGQKYIGFATATEAPSDKSGYQWVKIGGSESSGGNYLEKQQNKTGMRKAVCLTANKEGGIADQTGIYVQTSINSTASYESLPVRGTSEDVYHPNTFEVATPTLDKDKNAYSPLHPVTVALYEQLKEELENKIDEIATYEKIKILQWYALQSVYEKGEPCVNPRFYWSLNKKPNSTTLPANFKGSAAAKDCECYYNGSLTSDFNAKLTAKDERGAEAEAIATIRFYNGVYYGVTQYTGITNDRILGFTKSLQGSRLNEFTVTANSGEYIFYCVPVSYGECSFKVGGFDGGFSLVKTFNFENEYRHTEEYRIYQSDNAGLGKTTVEVL